ncbi:Dual specificity protein phosphatase 1 [Pelomyxa schiedti]|nr:Dual specificity protein phosphatase 1 [Pelomyxa schiedti]
MSTCTPPPQSQVTPNVDAVAPPPPAPAPPPLLPTKKGKGKIPRGASEILPGFLWLGSVFDAQDVSALQSLGINFVLDLASEWPPMTEPDSITYKHLPVVDKVHSDISAYFGEANAFIDKVKACGGKILVNCVMGKSRSATVVLQYLMTHNSMTFSQALSHVKAVREISPNCGFMYQLGLLEVTLYGAQTVATTAPPPVVPKKVCKHSETNK